MTRAPLVVVVLAGCQQIFDLESPARRIDAAIDDAMIDAALDAAVDAGPDAFACPPPPSGCTQVTCAASSSCYYACGSTTGLTWQAAQDACVSAGLGCLVTLDSASELTCITALNATIFDQIWIGYRQGSNPNEPDGGWSWQCGASTFESWANTEPNNFNGAEHCGAVVGDRMVDSSCTGQWRYVCEL